MLIRMLSTEFFNDMNADKDFWSFVMTIMTPTICTDRAFVSLFFKNGRPQTELFVMPPNSNVAQESLVKFALDKNGFLLPASVDMMIGTLASLCDANNENIVATALILMMPDEESARQRLRLGLYREHAGSFCIALLQLLYSKWKMHKAGVNVACEVDFDSAKQEDTEEEELVN